MPQLIHKFVPGTGSTVLLLHEDGANENDLIPIGRAVAKGAALLSPRLPVPTAELAEFVAQSAGKVYGLGYASGADLAATLLLEHPGVLSGAILMRGRLSRRLSNDAEPLPDLQGAPVLILAGQQDVVARPEDTEELARTLTTAGAKVEVHWMNEGHDLGPEDFQAAAKWMRSK